MLLIPNGNRRATFFLVKSTKLTFRSITKFSLILISLGNLRIIPTLRSELSKIGFRDLIINSSTPNLTFSL